MKTRGLTTSFALAGFLAASCLVAFSDEATTRKLVPLTTSLNSTVISLWNPRAQTSNSSFGVQSNQFGFNISGTTSIPIVVEACTNVSNPNWVPLLNYTLTNGTVYFTDPQWTNYPVRFYRLRSP
jgi:hypothetical protein